VASAWWAQTEFQHGSLLVVTVAPRPRAETTRRDRAPSHGGCRVRVTLTRTREVASCFSRFPLPAWRHLPCGLPDRVPVEWGRLVSISRSSRRPIATNQDDETDVVTYPGGSACVIDPEFEGGDVLASNPGWCCCWVQLFWQAQSLPRARSPRRLRPGAFPCGKAP